MAKIKDIIANKYELLEKLSSTSSSEVFIATNKNELRVDEVVIKLISETKQENHGVYENEIRALKGIQHEYIVTLLDEGQCPSSGVFYIVTPYISGETFDKWCHKQDESKQHELSAGVILKLLDALEAIHLKGFVHKDIKPSNIIVEDDGSPYLLDFGISRVVETLTTQLHQYSPFYVSPEENDRQAITPATDIYKLGITWIEALLDEQRTQEFYSQKLTLKDAIDYACTIVDVTASPYLDISLVSKDSFAGVAKDEVLSKLITKMSISVVDERYQNVRDVRTDLQQWFGHAETYALVWTITAQNKAKAALNCLPYDLNQKVEEKLTANSYAKWDKNERKGDSINLASEDFTLRIKADPSNNYFTIVDYQSSNNERLKQDGSILTDCKFVIYSSSRKITTVYNNSENLMGRLQSVALEKIRTQEKEKEAKSSLEQASAYQEALREIFERKRFKPIKVTVEKINRGKKELVCKVCNNLEITNECLTNDNALNNIKTKLQGWGIETNNNDLLKLLNRFVIKIDTYQSWVKKLTAPLKLFPKHNQVQLMSQSKKQEERQQMAYDVLFFLFPHELKKPQLNLYLPDKDTDIGFFESEPKNIKQRGESPPLLHGTLANKNVSHQGSTSKMLTLKYGDKQPDSKVNKGNDGWISHFSIREESQLKKLEDALKTLEDNKGVQEKLLETLANVQHLPPKDEASLQLDRYISTELDNDQKLAVAKCVLLETGQFAVLQGPPGTGKTTVITEVIQQILKHSPKAKILVASQSHQAVDNVLEKIHDKIRTVRLGEQDNLQGIAKRYSYKNIATTLLDEIKKNVKKEACYLDEQALDTISTGKLDQLEALRQEWVKKLSGRDSHLEKVLFKSIQVVFGTLVGMAANQYKEVNQLFDYVIIDEAGKAILSELSICMNRGQRIVLVGDHKQLPPVLDEESLSLLDQATKKSLKTTFFESLFSSLKRDRPEYCHQLRNNYRMNSDICEPVSTLFYEGRLQTPSIVNRNHGLHFDKSWYWLNSSRLPKHFEKTSGQGKYYNPCHIQIIHSLLERINTDCKTSNKKRTVGVIAPYRETITQLRRNIKPMINNWNCLDIKVETVDAFQGSDRDIIILDSVRSNQNKNLGFIADLARLNVAMSRAKSLLFIIGDAETLYDGSCPKDATNPYVDLIDMVRKDPNKFGWVDLTKTHGVKDV